MKIGTWAKAGSLVGIVSKIEDDGTVVIFNPGDRQMIRATPTQVTSLPMGTIEARVALRIDVPHGFSEDSLRRWLAALIDPVIRAHAQQAMNEQGLDDSPFRVAPTVEVSEVRA